jgi:hypothetical protein
MLYEPSETTNALTGIRARQRDGEQGSAIAMSLRPQPRWGSIQA